MAGAIHTLFPMRGSRLFQQRPRTGRSSWYFPLMGPNLVVCIGFGLIAGQFLFSSPRDSGNIAQRYWCRVTVAAEFFQRLFVSPIRVNGEIPTQFYQDARNRLHSSPSDTQDILSAHLIGSGFS